MKKEIFGIYVVLAIVLCSIRLYGAPNADAEDIMPVEVKSLMKDYEQGLMLLKIGGGFSGGSYSDEYKRFRRFEAWST